MVIILNVNKETEKLWHRAVRSFDSSQPRWRDMDRLVNPAMAMNFQRPYSPCLVCGSSISSKVWAFLYLTLGASTLTIREYCPCQIPVSDGRSKHIHIQYHFHARLSQPGFHINTRIRRFSDQQTRSLYSMEYSNANIKPTPSLHVGSKILRSGQQGTAGRP